MGLRLNCGSGQRPFDRNHGWINIDVQSVEGRVPDVVADIRCLPYDDGAAELIVLQHNVEHWGCGEAPLTEMHRVLAASGSLIVTCPDMRALAQAWLMGKLNDQLYFTNVYGAYMGSEYDRHKWGYTHETLEQELQASAPWAVVKAFDWRPLAGADVAHDWWMLGMEAIR